MKGLTVKSSQMKYDGPIIFRLRDIECETGRKFANRRPPSLRFLWAHALSSFPILTSL